MSISPHATLAEARAWVESQLLDGTTCPCCDQHAQQYRWSLYSSAVHMLAKLYAVYLRDGDVFTHSRDVKVPGQGGDGTRLRYWGLAEQASECREDGGKSGYWRITQLGIDFLMGRKSIPQYAEVFQGSVLGFDGPPVYIHDVRGKHFDYAEFVRTVRAARS